MWKTFPEFVHRACQMFNLTFDGATEEILQSLAQHKLTPTDVLCYINWADGNSLPAHKVGKNLGITRQAVDAHLHRLKKVWPHLFCFGPKIPRFDSRRSDRTGTMGRLRHDSSDEIESF